MDPVFLDSANLVNQDFPGNPGNHQNRRNTASGNTEGLDAKSRVGMGNDFSEKSSPMPAPAFEGEGGSPILAAKSVVGMGNDF